MTNTEVALALGQVADLMEIKGADAFRANAYRKAARSVKELAADISEVAARGELTQLPGVGKGTAERIQELLSTGRMQVREALAQEVPETLLKLLELPGVGPKTAGRLWQEYEITTVAAFKRLLMQGGLQHVKGFTPGVIAKLLAGIEFLEQNEGWWRLGEGWYVGTQVREAVMKMPGVQRVARAGALRRGCELLREVDLLCIASDGMHVIWQFIELPGVTRVLAADGMKASVLFDFRGGMSIPVNLRVVPEKSFGAAWLHFTGSPAHLRRLQDLAAQKEYGLNEFGLFTRERVVAARTEEEIYDKLAIPWIPPEMREDRGELTLMEIPADIVRMEHIRGDLHMHTSASDGRNTIDEMVRAAKARGYEYICITDHSPSSTIAGGLSVEELQAHIAEVRAVGQRVAGIEVLVGTEVDILPNGRLDYPNELLAQLDFVTASIHSGLDKSAEVNTKRTLAAIHNVYVNSIGHPTGRLIKERAPMPIDIEAVCREAARTRTALEINANYYRLDLKDEHLRIAREMGSNVVINTDAHSVDQLDQMHFGVLTARRAGLREHDVLNTRTAREVAYFVAAKRELAPKPVAGR
jgi:DNA polymerase (family 10)